MGIAMRGVINIDVTPALMVCQQLQRQLSRANFEFVVERTLKDTAGDQNRGIKSIIGHEIPREYEVTGKWVKSKIEGYKFAGSGSKCVVEIPIRGERGTLGGIFPASGGGYAAGRHTKKDKKRLKRGGAKVKAKVLKSTQSQLPDALGNQGGNPPFRMPNGAVMTRTTGNKLPIARVVGRAVPQMVDKQFERRLEGKINDYMVKRMEQLVKEKLGI